VKKIYLALVAGTPKKPRGTIDASIDRHPVQRKKMAINLTRGRIAKTDYRVLRSEGGVSLLECAIHSGRTHQIRVHLQHLGHPVLGDSLYGKKATAPRQMLHAWKIGFTHPRTKERHFLEAPLPGDFQAVLDTVFRPASR
jgi:23S rRNA pseudouridine1911/1915/1917 synthase